MTLTFKRYLDMVTGQINNSKNVIFAVKKNFHPADIAQTNRHRITQNLPEL